MHYLFFFPAVAVVYFSIPHRLRWIALLAASYYFYMCWKPEYALLIIVSTSVNYAAALFMGKTSNQKAKNTYLLVSIIANLGMLFGFKYFNFFNESARTLFSHFNFLYTIPAFNVLLPVGISFYTFQALGYTIDVYRGQREPEKHFGIFALYVAFFPQLVAGPIERSTRLLPQFFQKKEFDVHRATDGLKLMLWGLFKKVVIADRLALYVNAVYNNQAHHGGSTLLVATFFFSFQIYCDFSGYSDIAIGSARVFGYELMDNFKRPYFAQSIREFWKRWHISLSSWFKDYLYIPLGGSRVAEWRWQCNLMLVFVISGLWHGANWTFLAWGGLHGFYLLFAIWTSNLREKLAIRLFRDHYTRARKMAAMLMTFGLVSLSWIVFRANSITDVWYIGKKIVFFRGAFFIGELPNLLFSVFGILFLLIVELWEEYFSENILLAFRSHELVKQLYYAFLVIIILLTGVFDAGQFIYFQF